jgi:fluoroquinolone transport system permease protein
MREPFFWLILVAPILLGWLLRNFLPSIASEYERVDIAAYYPIIVALLVLASPLYYGIVLGLLVLEEKDENVLLAVAVTPLQLENYLLARILVYTLVSLPLIVIVHELIGVIEISLVKLIFVAIAASLNTAMVVLLLAAFCKNQLEGFVIGKSMSPFILLPLAMYFVPGYWHLLCGIIPTYWPIMAYYTAINESGSNLFFAITIIMSLTVQPTAAILLYRKFSRGLVLSTA